MAKKTLKLLKRERKVIQFLFRCIILACFLCTFPIKKRVVLKSKMCITLKKSSKMPNLRQILKN